MSRALASACLAILAGACGRSQGVSDEQLGGLVIDRKPPEAPIDVDRATKDPAELKRVLAMPYAEVIAALGPHTVKLATTNAVTEGGKPASALDEQTLIELGAKGELHALYTNSADYGRELILTGGKLYLRPRYQRWHERLPEYPEEPAELRDQYYGPIAAAWDLLAPGAELSDGGALQVGGRSARKIQIRRAPQPAAPPAEKLAQRKWREGRTIDELSGEVIIDVERRVPLSVKLAGAVGFQREGRKMTMKLGLEAAISGIGTAAAVAAPPRAEVVATPERLREVDERDSLLQGIAPPIRTGGAKPAPGAP